MWRKCLGLLMAVVLASCSQTENFSVYHKKPALSDSQHMALISQLQQDGVNVLVKGDSLTFVLPADAFFVQPGFKINPDKTADLVYMADIILGYQQPTVTVTGFSDHVGSRHSQLRRSRDMAQAISAFLWNQAVSVAKTQGVGAKQSVSANNTAMGAAQNRRVEVLVSESQAPVAMS